MANKLVSFEIEEEIEGLLNSLATDWKKDPVWLAQALFEQELKAQSAGKRGVPFLRKYMYRDSTPYFAPGEWEKLQEEYRRHQNDDPAEAVERQELFDRMERNFKKIARGEI